MKCRQKCLPKTGKIDRTLPRRRETAYCLVIRHFELTLIP